MFNRNDCADENAACRMFGGDKRDIRRSMKAQRDALTAGQKEHWDQQIRESFFALDMAGKSRSLYCYLSFGSEIDTIGLVRAFLDASGTVAVPRVIGGEIRFFQIRELSDCRPGYRGILEPMDSCPRADDPDALVILPGLAFTRGGDRLGYGGGYYDRFLAREAGHPTLALAYPFQILEKLPTEAYDRRVDCILTPDERIDTGEDEPMDLASMRRDIE